MARVVGLLAALLLACVPTFGAAAPLSAYGKLPGIEQVAISPDGQYLAIAGTDGDQRTVLIQRTADRQMMGGVRAGDQKLRALQWAGSNHVLMTVSVHGPLLIPSNALMRFSGGGLEHWGVIDFNLTTRKQTVLMNDVRLSLNVVYDTPVTRVIDGKPYAFLVGAWFEGGGDGLTLFRSDLDGGVTSVVEAGLPHASGWVVDGQGHPVAQTTYDAPTSKWTLRVKRDGAWPVIKTLTAPIERPDLRGLGKDGRSVMISDWVDQEAVLRELPLDASDWSAPIFKGEFATIHDPAGGALIGLRSQDGDVAHYQFFNPRDEAVWRAVQAAYPGQAVDLESASADHRKFVVRVDSPTDGPAFALVDLDAKSARWIGAEFAELTPKDIGEKHAITFKAADGMALTGYLTLPHGKTAKDLPLVVLAHGGPAARDEPGFDWWAQGLASQGYAVLQVNYRGSDGFGWKYLAAGFGEWGRKMQTDLSDGVRYLAAQGEIDAKRVCIVGGSYGGYAALAGATLDRGVYRCAVSIAGPSDLRRMVAKQKDSEGFQGVGVERYWTRFMGAENLSNSHLQEISPAEQAAKDDIPILLIHGSDDTVVPYEQSRIMQDALKRAGKPVSLVTLKSEDHWLSRGATRLQMLQATVDFLQKNDPAT